MTLDKNSKNALGSVVALTNSSGDLVETYRYDSFGKPLDVTWDATWKSVHPFKNPLRYTARYVNGEIFEYRNRYYDPHTRRFLTEDPLRFVDGINRYVYVGNDPVNFIDPWGLQDTPNVGDFIGGLQDAADDWAERRLYGEMITTLERYEQNLPEGVVQEVNVYYNDSTKRVIGIGPSGEPAIFGPDTVVKKITATGKNKCGGN